MVKPDPNHDHDNDQDDANDNNKGTVIPTPTATGALTSVAALGTVLNAVNTASVGGRSGLPLMQFKSRENGTWMFGQRRTIPEDGSRWAVNPATFKHGYVCFGPNKKVLDERLVAANLPKPNLAELPDTGAKWQDEWAVAMKCVSGVDAGVEVIFKIATDGGAQAIIGLIDTVKDRINGGQHDGKVVPIVLLENGSYTHSDHGRVWTPALTVVDWMSLEGPAPAPKAPPSPPSSDPQPRRRRVA